MIRYRPRFSHMITGCLIIGLGLLSVGPPAGAQSDAQPDRPRAEDFFFAEFMGGSIGGALGVSLLEQFLANACAGADEPRLCWTFGRSVLRPLGYPLLVFVGSSVGIVTAGSLAGVQGNATAALIGDFLGASGGMAVAAGIWLGILQPLFEPGAAEELVEPEETPDYLKRTFPLVMRVLRPHQEMIRNSVYIAFPILFATYFGTQGFNVGAQMAPTDRP